MLPVIVAGTCDGPCTWVTAPQPAHTYENLVYRHVPSGTVQCLAGSPQLSECTLTGMHQQILTFHILMSPFAVPGVVQGTCAPDGAPQYRQAGRAGDQTA